MKKPHGIYTDNSSRVYVTDTGSNMVFILNESGELIQSIASVSGQSLTLPTDIAVYKLKKNIYKAFLIDQDQIIILLLKYNQTGE